MILSMSFSPVYVWDSYDFFTLFKACRRHRAGGSKKPKGKHINIQTIIITSSSLSHWTFLFDKSAHFIRLLTWLRQLYLWRIITTTPTGVLKFPFVLQHIALAEVVILHLWCSVVTDGYKIALWLTAVHGHSALHCRAAWIIAFN